MICDLNIVYWFITLHDFSCNPIIKICCFVTDSFGKSCIIIYTTYNPIGNTQCQLQLQVPLIVTTQCRLTVASCRSQRNHHSPRAFDKNITQRSTELLRCIRVRAFAAKVSYYIAKNGKRSPLAMNMVVVVTDGFRRVNSCHDKRRTQVHRFDHRIEVRWILLINV